MQKTLYKKLAYLIILFVFINIILTCATKMLYQSLGLKQDYNLITIIIIILTTAINILFLNFYNKYILNMLKIKRNPHTEKKKCALYFGIGGLIGLAFMSICIFIRYIFGFTVAVSILNHNIVINLLFGAVIVFNQIIIEEFLIRKILYSDLRNAGCSFLKAMLISSMLFAFFHISKGKGLIDYLFIFLLSLLMTYFFEVTQNMWLGSGFHFGWNYISNGVNVLNVTYINMTSIQLIYYKSISIGIIIFILLISIFLTNKRSKGEKNEKLYENQE